MMLAEARTRGISDATSDHSRQWGRRGRRPVGQQRRPVRIVGRNRPQVDASRSLDDSAAHCRAHGRAAESGPPLLERSISDWSSQRSKQRATHPNVLDVVEELLTDLGPTSDCPRATPVGTSRRHLGNVARTGAEPEIARSHQRHAHPCRRPLMTAEGSPRCLQRAGLFRHRVDRPIARPPPPPPPLGRTRQTGERRPGAQTPRAVEGSVQNSSTDREAGRLTTKKLKWHFARDLVGEWSRRMCAYRVGGALT